MLRTQQGKLKRVHSVADIGGRTCSTKEIGLKSFYSLRNQTAIRIAAITMTIVQTRWLRPACPQTWISSSKTGLPLQLILCHSLPQHDILPWLFLFVILFWLALQRQEWLLCPRFSRFAVESKTSQKHDQSTRISKNITNASLSARTSSRNGGKLQAGGRVSPEA